MEDNQRVDGKVWIASNVLAYSGLNPDTDFERRTLELRSVVGIYHIRQHLKRVMRACVESELCDSSTLYQQIVHIKTSYIFSKMHIDRNDRLRRRANCSGAQSCHRLLSIVWDVQRDRRLVRVTGSIHCNIAIV